MTLLSLCQDVADISGFARPTTIISSGNQTARQLLALLKSEGQAILRRHAWSALIRDHTITTVNGTETYTLPSDFQRYIDNTAWDSTNYWNMRGSLSPQEWQHRKYAIISTTNFRKTFAVKWDSSNSAKRVFIDPIPTAAETLVIEYITDQYIESSGGTGQATWAADTDVLRLDEELFRLALVYRWLKAKGLPYADEYQEYKSHLSLCIAQDVPSVPIDLAKSEGLFTNIPESGFGA